MASLPVVVTISHLLPDRGGTSGRPALNHPSPQPAKVNSP